jgi:hypothetical protein
MPATADLDVSGRWDVSVSFLRGERTHAIQLRQQNSTITGSQSSHQFEGPVSGSVDANGIHLVFSMWHEGTMIAYRLDGFASDDQMRGSVTLGSATHQHQGAINLAQFGPGLFQGVRTAGA